MDKVNMELRKQLMGIIQLEIDDPMVDFLSITRVETTSDLQESKVYFSLLDETKYKEAQKILDGMKGFIRSLLAKRIRLKILPQLNFIPDESIKYSVDIYQKIEEIKKSDRKDEKEVTEKNNSQDK
jgi:ribosome-binding factor A